jgi:ankyrin repeat protein
MLATKIKSLLEIQENSQQKTALMEAIEGRNNTIIQLVLDAYQTSADNTGLCLQDAQQKTALIYAIETNNITAASNILARQPRTVTITTGGKTPLMHAIEYDDVKMVKLLLQYPQNLQSKDSRGFTALDYARGMKKANYDNATEIYDLIDAVLRKKERDLDFSGEYDAIENQPSKKQRR